MLFPDLVTASSSSLSFLSVIRLAQQNKMRFDLFAWTVSLIWLRRNKVCLGEDVDLLSRIPSMASDALQEFHQLRPIHAKLPRTFKAVKWHPPSASLMKVNFDEALFAGERKAGLSAIIHNDNGLVMAALSQNISLPVSVEMVEVLAAHQALWLAKELRFQRLIVEGDSESIINAINGENMAWFEYGHISQDIRLLISFFCFVSFCHVRRQGNCMVHCLARRAISSSLDVWIESVPLNTLDVYNAGLPLID